MDSRLVYVVDATRHLLGVISSYDLLRTMLPFYLDSNLAKALPDDDAVILQAFEACQNRTAGEIMTREFVAVHPDDTFLEAEALIAEHGISVLPVLEADGQLVGAVSRRAILNALAAQCGFNSEA